MGLPACAYTIGRPTGPPVSPPDCAHLTNHPTEPLTDSQDPAGWRKLPKLGLRVLKVEEDGAGQRAGLRPSDRIFQYGVAEVLDKASYYTAREKYQNCRVGQVQLVAWRGNGPLTFTVPVGRLDIETEEFNPAAYKFYSVADKAEGVNRLPEDILRREKEAGRYQSPESILQEARRLLDAAEREGSLTPAQALVARIYLTPDDAPPDEVSAQLELLRRLIDTQPRDFVATLGHERFFRGQRNRAAVECFKAKLEAHPSDISTRLNLGVSYNRLGMHREAAAAADYVLDREMVMSEHGYSMAYQVKALAALGLGDVRAALEYAGRHFELEPNDFGMSLWQLAAAKGGDLRQFYEVSRACREALPEDYERLRRQADAAEAYALVKAGRPAEAQQVARRWPTEEDAAKVRRYWGLYPGGADVADTWAGLLKNNN